MGSKRVGLFIILFLQLFLDCAASYPQKPLQKTNHLPQNDPKIETRMKQTRKIDHRFGDGTDNAVMRANEGARGRRYLQGKASFIPIYAAGAARRRRRERSSGGYRRSSGGLSSVVAAATLASLLHFYGV